MNTNNQSNVLLPALLGAASLFLSGNLFGTFTIQDDLVVEGDTTLEKSLEIGTNADASGTHAIAGGVWSVASGSHSIAIGEEAWATDWGAVSLGIWNYASGMGSFAVNEANTASGRYSAAFGLDTIASGRRAASFGLVTRAQGLEQVVLGRYNVAQGSATTWVDTDDIFIIGNGTGPSDRSNAFSVQKNGNAEFAGTVRVQPGGDISMGNFTSSP